ncbi:DNA alkylation repair protein [Acidobacteriota bacterium]
MADKLKDMFFTGSSIKQFADTIKQYYPEFDTEKFVNLIFNDEWESKELKEKMHHTTICLHETLPGNYKQALNILVKIAPTIKGFEAMVLPDYVEQYGMGNWDLSLPALGHFTKFSSSEFAIRPFLLKDPKRVMAYMNEWAEDKNENVRRFASEGCRPRLPWAMALPDFKKDPGLILPILEKLKNDESDSVRRSVANNLNDISKDHPGLILDICERWYGQSERTNWIVKHACRTLLKSGNKRALLLFGYGDSPQMSIDKIKLGEKTVMIGKYLLFSFQLIMATKKASKVRLEYRVDFMKAKGKQSGKVFKITENTYKPGIHSFSRKHSFADMSTRKHYEGEHGITIIVNGDEKAKAYFSVRRWQ